jgi:uncharacterized membrane protein YfcA
VSALGAAFRTWHRGPAAPVAAGSIVGSQLAARYRGRLSARARRTVIASLGIAAIVQLVA